MLLGKPPEAITKDERQIAKSATFGLVCGRALPGLRSYAKATYRIDLSPRRSQEIRNPATSSASGRSFFREISSIASIWSGQAASNANRICSSWQQLSGGRNGRSDTGTRRLV